MEKKKAINTNTIVKMSLDVVMTILFILLMKTSFTGIELHEALGIGIFTLFITHNILNHKWIRAMCRNIIKGSIKGKAKFSFVLNALLIVFTSITVVTGILISQAIFPRATTDNTAMFSNIHHLSAYLAFLMISVHIGLHWSMISNFFKKVFRVKNETGATPWLSRVAALIITVLCFKAILFTDIQSNFISSLGMNNNGVTAYAKSTSSSVDETGTTISSTTGLVVDSPTLDDFLSGLCCSGCSRRCPLISLQCGRGESYKEQATTEYNQKYSTSSSASTSTDTSTSTNAASNITDTNEASSNTASPVDYLGVMGYVVGGTHYTLSKRTKQ